MKSTIQLFAIFFATSFISSCVGYVKSDSEIKLIPVANGKYFQYIDKEGKIVINPQFSEATIFRNGLALVQSSGDKPQWGFIGEDGKYVISPNYESATVFSDDLAWVVCENSPPRAIDNKGVIKFSLPNVEKVNIFAEGLAAFSIIDSSGEKWGFVNKVGKVAISPQFKKTDRFSEGRCAVENNEGKWGFIDKKGKIIINYQFTEIGERFINSKAIVYLDDRAGVIDESGKFLINPQFSFIQNDGDKYLIKQDQEFGWTDKDGKIIINPQFINAHPFLGSKLAAVLSGTSWGYIDIDGKIEINPQFDKAYPYNGKLALVESSGKLGFIDAEGKYVINPQYDKVSNDFLSYVMDGSSMFETVVTDFFNITSIVNRVNLNTPEGLSLSSNLNDVVTKLKITENEFSKNSIEHMVIKNEIINNDASVSFYVIANAFKDIPDGWYSKRVLNLESVVQGYAYVISLRGKGYGKEKDVKDAIEKTFTVYKKDEIQSIEGNNIFKNEKQTIHSFIMNDNGIVIYIKNNLNETDQNEQKQDSIPIYSDAPPPAQ